MEIKNKIWLNQNTREYILKRALERKEGKRKRVKPSEMLKKIQEHSMQ